MYVVHNKRDRYDVYIGRPSIWGNPFAIGRDGTRQQVLMKYEAKLRVLNIMLNGALFEYIRTELAGKTLGCWCAPQPCHGDILAFIAQGGE